MTGVRGSISGQFTIEDQENSENNIVIPVRADYPSKTKDESGNTYYKFDFEASKIGDSYDYAEAKKLDVGKFLAWASSKIGLASTKNDLPSAMRNFEIAATRLKLDTDSALDLSVVVGSDNNGTFVPKWDIISINSNTLSLTELTLSVSYGDFKPIIHEIDKTEGAVGETVKITGEEFDESTKVFFSSDKEATITNRATDGKTIEVTVPNGATDGPIVVKKTINPSTDVSEATTLQAMSEKFAVTSA